MWRIRVSLLLGFFLLGSSLIAADMLQPGAGQSQKSGMIGPTAAGYYFAMTTTSGTLYFYPGSQPTTNSVAASDYPVLAQLTVQVENTQGRPVDGIPVAFELEPKSRLSGMLHISAAKATTKDGTVQVNVWLDKSVEATSAGRIIARVDNMTAWTGMSVELSPVRPN